MQKYQNNVTDLTGSAVVGVQVTVTTIGGVLATIYSDNGGTLAPNPLTTDSNGYVEFYAPNGRYDVTVAGAGGYTDVMLVDGVEISENSLTKDEAAANNGATLVGAGDEGTVQEALDERAKKSELGYIDCLWFGASEAASDNWAALTAAGVAARAAKLPLVLQDADVGYASSDTVDWSDIKVIRAGGGRIRTSFTGKPALIIGGNASNFRNADLDVAVINTADKSLNSLDVGIVLRSCSNSQLRLYFRGYYDGLQFDGVSANRVWVDNQYKIVEAYNNRNQVHYKLGGLSYAVKGQFIGGSYYLGTGQTDTGNGVFKMTLTGSGLVQDQLVQSPEIGLEVNSWSADYAVFMQADINTTWDINTIQFIDARFEGYGTWGTNSPRAVNIATNTSGLLGVDIQLGGSASTETIWTFGIAQPTLRANKIRLLNNAIRAQGSRAYPQEVSPTAPIPYQTSNRCYVPDRVIYDATTGYNNPQDFFTTSFASNGPSRAVGDGDLLSGTTTDSYGLIYTKPVGQTSFFELHTPEQFAVICFDASGNVLSGSSPSYAVGESYRPMTRTGAAIYEVNGRWLWLHKDVASFYIGAARWSSNGHLRDISFNVLYGGVVRLLNTARRSPPGMVANASPNQCWFGIGIEIGGSASDWRSILMVKTAATVAANAADTTITVASAAGLANGDPIGIELNTAIATGYGRYHFTTVSGAPAGNVITLAAALPDGVAIGKTVIGGRWLAVARTVGRGTTANRPTLGASDIGALYMDTTLVAAGKPIWWTGTTWVDATGVAV